MSGRAVRILIAVVALAVVLSGCTVPRPAGDGQLRYRDSVFSGATVTRDLQYGSAPDLQGNPQSLKLDLYEPTGDTAQRRPAYVWIHGGAYLYGDKAGETRVPTAFARRGYVVVSINYRLLATKGCSGPPSPECENAAIAAQHDAQAAVRWVRANAATYKVDPDRIAVGGASAGAVTALLVGTRADDPGTSGNPGLSSSVRAAVSVMGGTPTQEYIDASDAPTIFFHGTQDTTVPYAWAVNNAARMYNLKIPVALYPFDGVGHALNGSESAIDQQSSYFLYHLLGLGSASAARAAERIGRERAEQMLKDPKAQAVLKRSLRSER